MDPLTATIISSIISAVEPLLTESKPEPVPFGIVRPMPPGSAKAVMEPPGEGYAKFGGKPLLLAPGLQIRNTQNLIVQSGSIQQPVTVRYQIDPAGAVNRVWMLSAAEASLPDPK